MLFALPSLPSYFDGLRQLPNLPKVLEKVPKPGTPYQQAVSRLDAVSHPR